MVCIRNDLGPPSWKMVSIYQTTSKFDEERIRGFEIGDDYR